MSDPSTATRRAGRAVPSNAPTPKLYRAPLVGLDSPAEIAGYQILGELGRGGMGVVYKAHDPRLGRIVALKMILGARFAHPEDLIRFRLEAETAAALSHPNIVQVHEVGTFQGQPYMVLEHVGGGTLSARLKAGPVPVSDAVGLVETLARAAHVAHLRGVVHRDLKPSNILLCVKSQITNPKSQQEAASLGFEVCDLGFPKVSDFGLAKHLDRGGMTETGRVLGTPDYMAPEQAEGKREVGPAADVYALGVILYEMLAGRTPFDASGPDGLLRVLAEEPPPLRAFAPEVPRDLATICHKCLEKDPAKRYESAAALADDLRLFTEGKPIAARPVSSWERFAK